MSVALIERRETELSLLRQIVALREAELAELRRQSGEPSAPTIALPATSDFQRLTVEDVAQALKVNRSTVYRAIECGELVAERVGQSGRAVRLRPADVNDWVAKRSRPGMIVHQPVTKWGRAFQMPARETRPTSIRRNRKNPPGLNPDGSKESLREK